MVKAEKNYIETTHTHLSNFWEYGVNEQFAMAIWRLPMQDTLHFLADFSGKPNKTKIELDESISGFCFSPFINANGSETLLLKNDIHFVFKQNGELSYEKDFSLEKRMFFDKIKKNIFKESTSNKLNKSSIALKNIEGKEIFEKIVNNAIEKIKQGDFQKVVLSRSKKVEVRPDFDLISTIYNLSVKYPKAFISAIYLPESNTIWLGASPELLVSLDKNGLFKTMSLAGTQSANASNQTTISPNNARWSQKEIEEQALVSRYIIECFKKVRVREYIETGPKTVEAGNLLHLQTDFIVDTKAIEFNQFATVLLELLHPTSAVCGMPKIPALDYILQNESYQRDFYSGYLGPVNIENDTQIFVNLRTLKLNGNIAELYAGAGITQDSIPENEWNETEMKMATLLQILQEKTPQ
jgi:isochorismate synthase